jgi:HAMP domain-containing protein
MRIRTQLVLACFLLSILPLAGIVLYSYRSSREALESAYRSEATRTTKQMDRRLTAIRGELEQRLAELSMFPLQMTSSAPAADTHMASDVMTALGDSARLLDSVEIRPMPAPAAPKSAHVAVRAKVAAAAAPASSERIPSIPATPDVHVEVATDAAAAMTPIVIGIPERMPHVTPVGMSAEQQNKLHELGRLATQLATGAATMSKEDRASLEKEMDDLQKAFSRDMEQSQKTFGEKLKASLAATEQQRKAGLAQQLAAARIWQRAVQKGPAPTAESAESSGSAEAAAESDASSADSSPVDSTSPVVSRDVSPDRSARMREHQKRVSAIFGRELSIPVRRNGAVVANLSAQVRLEEIIRRVLGGSSDDGEISFAVDRDGNLYTRSKADRQTLDRLGVSRAAIAGAPLPRLTDWIVALSKDAQSGVRIGVMRPCSTDLAGLRRAAAVNFSAGIALIVVALIGIVPVANHISRDVKLVTAGAERIALGDLTTRVPVTSHNEFGQLATAFNKMAADLSQHQQTIVDQERTRKEQELQQRMLEMEYSRKSVELEEARRFQLSMLPKDLPAHGAFDVAVSTETATEVGGDYYDFHLSPKGALTIAVGDATGHGAKAGTMITVAKTLF